MLKQLEIRENENENKKLCNEAEKVANNKIFHNFTEKVI